MIMTNQPSVPGVHYPASYGGVTLIKDKAGKVIRKSRNLSAITRHTATLKHWRCGPTIQVWRLPDSEGVLRIDWPDGSYCVERFASYGVMGAWVLNKQHRSFYGMAFIEHGSNAVGKEGSVYVPR